MANIYENITSFIGGEIHLNIIPQNITLPATLFKVTDTNRIRNLNGYQDCGMVEYLVAFVIKGSTRAQTVSEGQRILTKILDYRGSFGTATVKDIIIENDLDDEEEINDRMIYTRYIETKMIF